MAIAQQDYTIKVHVKNVAPAAKAYLYHMVNQKVFEDSVGLTGEEFIFKGSQSTPMKAYILLSHNGVPIKNISEPDKVGVYLQSGDVVVNTADSLIHARVKGTLLNDEQQMMLDLLSRFSDTTKNMITAYDDPRSNESDKERIKSEYSTLEEHRKDAISNFVKSHPNSLVSLNLLLTQVDPAREMKRAQSLYAILNPSIQNSANGVSYKTAIMQADVDLIEGSIAPGFSLKNPNGEEISLESFKGKYVLIDFWASWCIPCREENPNVVKAFEKYKGKNFTVLGISLDGGKGARENWVNAIKNDGLPWEQVSELLGWQGKISKRYKVGAIPANFLIDPNGKIVGRNLRGADLDNKLKELFKN